MKTSHVIGASEAAKAMGLSDYGSAYEWWLERTGRISRGPQTRAQEVGLLLEPVILADFEKRNDVELMRPVPSRSHPRHEWARATPDGLLTREMCSHAFIERLRIEGDEVIVVDAKSVMMQADVPQSVINQKWGELSWSDEVPREYAVQLQQQMAVFDGWNGKRCRRAFLTAWIQGREAIDYHMQAMPDFQAMLLDTLADISFRHLVCDEPMEPSTTDDWDDAARAAMQRMSVTKKHKREATDDEAALMAQYLEARQQVKVAEEKKAMAKAKLTGSIADGYAIESDAYRCSLSEGYESTRIKAAAVLDEIDLIVGMPENIRAQIARIKKAHSTTGWAGRKLTVTERKQR